MDRALSGHAPSYIWLTTAASSPKPAQEDSGWHSNAPHQSYADQLGWQSPQCNWTSSLEQFSDLRQLDLSYSCSETFLLRQCDQSSMWTLPPF